MRQYLAFTKKEWLEQIRTGKLLVLAIVFVLFGIMNPALAKITPWMMEMMSDQLAQTGMTVTAVEVDALTSWTQFFKNMPLALVVFLIMSAGIFTAEYQKGTLINIVTKGMKRWKIYFSKMCVMEAVWTLGCLLSYSITYGYNAYFWDNSIVHHINFAVFAFWLFGSGLIFVLGLASAFCNSSAVVMLIVAAAFGVSYLASLFPALKEYSPSYLLESAGLLAGGEGTGAYMSAILVTIGLILVGNVLAVIGFDRKNI